MSSVATLAVLAIVALRKESVDRNPNYIKRFVMSVVVALRKESVDRNQVAVHCDTLSAVALRKESVDRNCRKSLTDRRH